MRLVFEDEGPGIPDLNLAMTDGWTSGTGLGMGLSGARRLVNEFELQAGRRRNPGDHRPVEMKSGSLLAGGAGAVMGISGRKGHRRVPPCTAKRLR